MAPPREELSSFFIWYIVSTLEYTFRMNARLEIPHRAQRELLSGSQLFAGLPLRLLDELSAASHLVEGHANQTIFQAGDPIREAHLLFNGSVTRSRIIPGGGSRVVELVQSEQMLSMGELFGATHYASTCNATAHTLLVAIDMCKLREVVQQSPELSCRIITALARQQCVSESGVAGYHHGMTGAQRLLDYLLELAGNKTELAGETSVQLKASKKMIAARIGMTPESLSRNLRDLSDSGVIIVDGRNVHIQNAALLDTVSGASKQRLNFYRKRKGEGPLSAKTPSPGALVNRCGRLRLFSQRMALTWGAIAANVASSATKTRLRQFEKEFERNLAWLEQPELAREFLEKLNAIKPLWLSYRQAIGSEEATETLAEKLFVLSEKMLTATDELTACAAHLAGIPSAHYVNMAGRNRVLSQRISKFFLFREWGSLHARIDDLLLPSCTEFENNLQHLVRTGSGQPELAAQLQIVARQWQKYIRALCPDLTHARKTIHARIVLAEGERLLRCVDTAVKIFERLT